mgnify:CR=1 FL=1
MRPMPPPRLLLPLLVLAPLVCASNALAKRKAPEAQLPSCEQVLQTHVEASSSRGPRDLSHSDFSSVLDRGSYLEACGVPEQASVRICVAIREGSAVGVTVELSPDDADQTECLREQIRGLAFPSHPKLDVVRTTFAPDTEDEKPKQAYVPKFAEAPPAAPPKKSGCACSVLGERGEDGALALGLLAALLGGRRARPTRPRARC